MSPLYFFLKNLATFFRCQFCGVTPDFFFAKTDNLFLLIALSLLLFSLGCHPPPSRVSPTPFLPVRPRFSTILCKLLNLPTNFFSFGCHPLEGVTWGCPPPPPPPSDATAPRPIFRDRDHNPVFVTFSSAI